MQYQVSVQGNVPLVLEYYNLLLTELKKSLLEQKILNFDRNKWSDVRRPLLRMIYIN